MISRRNIRVKVMQTLYTLNTVDGEQKNDPTKLLQKQIDASRQLFIYLLYTLTEVARYAETDSLRRASKNLPSQQDLNVNTKLSGNEYLWKILENPSFKRAINAEKPNQVEGSKDAIRRLYNELTASPEYRTYITAQGRERKSEKEIITFIFSNLMLPSEDFTGHIEEHFPNWDDDADMMEQLVLNFLNHKATTEKIDFVKATDDQLKAVIKKFTKDAEKSNNYLVFRFKTEGHALTNQVDYISDQLSLPPARVIMVADENYDEHVLEISSELNLQEILGQEKWHFAKNLLTTVREKRAYALELIKPKLKNWDAERIAMLDMILMEMGVCELLYFETIPTKVTINEYIDLAKAYSTPQSGQFVNGILDNIHKDLLTQNKIHKVNFKDR
jgi:transcription antitermination factor NusB